VDALVTILKHNGINAILKWVDDFCIFHIPTHSTMNDQNETLKHYSIDLMSVFSVTDPLGMLWHPIWVKGEDFASSVIYVGFLWNLRDHMVTLLDKNQLKYLGKVQAFQSNAKAKVSHKDVMAIHGTLQHITFVYRQGHSSLPPFSSFIAKFPNDFACHHFPRSVIEALTWWEAILQSLSGCCSLFPHPVIDQEVWVNVSTDWGIGIVLGHLWAAWRLKPSWRTDGCNIGWAESVALELAILWLIQAGHIYCNITIHGDNTRVIGAFNKGHSHNIPHNDSICHMATSLIPNNISISPVYVSSTSNKTNTISCSTLGPPSLWRLESIQLPAELEKFMSRLLAEARAKACSMSSGGLEAFVPPSLLLLETCASRPRLSSNPQN